MIYELIDTRSGKTELDLIYLKQEDIKTYFKNLKEFEKELFIEYNSEYLKEYNVIYK